MMIYIIVEKDICSDSYLSIESIWSSLEKAEKRIEELEEFSGFYDIVEKELDFGALI